MGLLGTDTWLTVATSGVLIILYGATLIKAWKGSKYQFVIKLLVLLIFSNIGIAFDKFGLYEYSKFLSKNTDNAPIFWILLISISGFI